MKYTRHNIKKGVCLKVLKESEYMYRIERIYLGLTSEYDKSVELVDVKNLDLGNVITTTINDIITDLNTNHIHIVKKIDYEIY
jgi:hypothetical protein